MTGLVSRRKVERLEIKGADEVRSLLHDANHREKVKSQVVSVALHLEAKTEPSLSINHVRFAKAIEVK